MHLMTILLNVYIFPLLLRFPSTFCSPLKPIVIVPGVGGSQIQGWLSRNETKHYWCYKKSVDWFTLWLSLEELLPYSKECWVDNIKLVYNPKTKKVENTPGVTTRVPDFGNTTAIEWLDPSVHGPGSYFYPLVNFLTQNGYKRGINLYGAPYDYRYHPGDAEQYFIKLENLIEDAYAKQGKVVIISHSMGAPYTLYFLNRQPQLWKDKFIDKWITISGAWAGSVNVVLAYISGYGFGIPQVVDKPLTLRRFQRTFSSLPYLLPDPRFWKKSEVLVKTKNRTYGVGDWDVLFDDIRFPLAKKILYMTPPAWEEEAPNVETHCLYGTEVATPMVLKYRPGYFPDYVPDMDYGSGDGTVPVRSLEACKRWVGKSTKNVTAQHFPMAEHGGILADPRLFSAVKAIIFPE